MRSQVPRTLVCLGLDDPPYLTAGGTCVDQVHAEEVARDEKRFAGVEGEGEESG
jgi:hypothetical protein